MQGITNARTASEMDRMHLLWENPSPSSDFDAQTVNVDWSKYRYLIIQAGGQPAYAQSVNNLNLIDNIGTFNITGLDNSFNIAMTREADITKSSISFLTGKYGSARSNGYCIPLKIYGMN